MGSEAGENKSRAGHDTRAPQVSVIIPAYNSALFISETMESVFSQTFSDFEVIIINDGSPDTEALERALQPWMNRIIYVKQPNRGPSAARNTGIGVARGEFLAFLDSDDSWLPEYLAEQMACLEKTPELDVVCADTLFYGDSPLAGQTFLERSKLRGPVTFMGMLEVGNALTTSCVVARKQAVVAAGVFDEGLRVAEDYELWLRLAHQGSAIERQWKVLARHRVHGGSLAAEEDETWMAGHVAMAKKLQTKLQLSREEKELLQRKLTWFQALYDRERGKQFLFRGEFEEAQNAFSRANAELPSRKLRLTLAGLRVAPRLTRLGVRILQPPGRQSDGTGETKKPRWRIFRPRATKKSSFTQT